MIEDRVPDRSNGGPLTKTTNAQLGKICLMPNLAGNCLTPNLGKVTSCVLIWKSSLGFPLNTVDLGFHNWQY